MDKAVKYDIKNLHIVHYPAPCLRERCTPITQFGDGLVALAQRMHELMLADRGVGLAAPQVGILERLFVANLTGEPGDAMVFVNPVISQRAGNEEAEEGCLSIPGVHVNVRRAKSCRIDAQDLTGQPITLVGEDLLARVWQHETDHLDGVLIIDRMGPADRIANRKTLRALEEGHAATRS